MTCIYALYDPRIPGLPFYVGKGLEKRAKYHWRKFCLKGTAVNFRLKKWFKTLQADGVEPVWSFLEENIEDWKEAEKDWIEGARKVNSQLCNVSIGGNEVSVEGCRIAGYNVGKNYGSIGAKRAHELHPNMASENGLKNAQKPGYFSRIGLIRYSRGYKVPFHVTSKAGKARARWTNHVRWHVKRGVVNSNCDLCQNA